MHSPTMIFKATPVTTRIYHSMDSSQDFSNTSAAPDAKGMMVNPVGMMVNPVGMMVIPHGIGKIPHGVGITPHGVGITPHGVGFVNGRK